MTFQGLNLIFGPSYAADAARPLHPASSVHPFAVRAVTIAYT